MSGVEDYEDAAAWGMSVVDIYEYAALWGLSVVDNSPEGFAEREARLASRMRAAEEIERMKKRDGRRERRDRRARGIAAVKAAQKAGLPVKRATIDGIEMELGEAE
jgi:hypothetical protein